MSFLRRIPYLPLVIAAIALGLAPLSLQPHLVEKIDLLIAGGMFRPIDIFDLIMHMAPTLLIIMKLIEGRNIQR